MQSHLLLQKKYARLKKQISPCTFQLLSQRVHHRICTYTSSICLLIVLGCIIFPQSGFGQCPDISNAPNCYDNCVGFADKDNDGIPDQFDIDDDNDGIVDTREIDRTNLMSQQIFFDGFEGGIGATLPASVTVIGQDAALYSLNPMQNMEDENGNANEGNGGLFGSPQSNGIDIGCAVGEEQCEAVLVSYPFTFSCAKFGGVEDASITGNNGLFHNSCSAEPNVNADGDATPGELICYRTELEAGEYSFNFKALNIFDGLDYNFTVTIVNASTGDVIGSSSEDVPGGTKGQLINGQVTAIIVCAPGLYDVCVSTSLVGQGADILFDDFELLQVTGVDVDTDGDGLVDRLDLDSDNDGIPDAVEAYSDISLVLEDCSLDSNGDAMYVPDENGCNSGLVVPTRCDVLSDSDLDGIPDYQELDADDDGCADAREASTDQFGANTTTFSNISVDGCGLLTTGISGTCPIPSNTDWTDARESIVKATAEESVNCNSNQGEIDITITGGEGVYTLTSDPSSTLTPNMLGTNGMSGVSTTTVMTDATEGDLDVMIIDANGCEDTVSVTLTPDCALPVELISFIGKTTDKGIALHWKTASEQNNSHFLIERSRDGKQFTSIGKVQGAGTTLKEQQYMFIDEVPLKGVNYYRLKQVDFDNAYAYSDIEAVHINEKDETLAVFPIPAKEVLNYNIAQLEGIEAIYLFDIMGRLVKTDRVLDGTLDISDLPSGQYTLIFEGKGQRVHRLVQKL